MPVTLELLEARSLIRLEGEVTVTDAEELKKSLLAGLASGKDLRLDLERAEEIDITVMQLLWVAGREAERTGVGIAICASEAAGLAARDAGFEPFPGLQVQG